MVIGATRSPPQDPQPVAGQCDGFIHQSLWLTELEDSTKFAEMSNNRGAFQARRSAARTSRAAPYPCTINRIARLVTSPICLDIC
jgi:hypothetical protein